METTMQKWEYLILDSSYDKEFYQKLADAGVDGWEATGFSSAGEFGSDLVVLLKRSMAAGVVGDFTPRVGAVVLTSFGADKIGVIKAIREITGLGLKEAKDLVEGVPQPIKNGVGSITAADIKKRLEDVGASVEIKY